MGITMVRKKLFLQIIEEKETLFSVNRNLAEEHNKLKREYDALKTLASQLESESSISRDKIDQLNDDLQKMSNICKVLLNTDKTMTPIIMEDTNFDHILEKFDNLFATISDPKYKREDHKELNDSYLRDGNRILKFINIKLDKFKKCLKERQDEKTKLEIQSVDNNSQLEWLEKVISVAEIVKEKIHQLIKIISD